MNERILIAGIGNIFLGDDAFGSEVARNLLTRDRQAGVKVVDFGIRGLDLAYSLLDAWEYVILVDAISRGDAPGTLYVIEPDLRRINDGSLPPGLIDAHSMDPVKVLQLAASLGKIPDNIHVVGCEPGDLGGEEGTMGLTEAVRHAVPEAIRTLEDLVLRFLRSHDPESTQHSVSR